MTQVQHLVKHSRMCRRLPLADYPRNAPAIQYEGDMGIWSALDGDVITPEQACDICVPVYERGIA